MHTTRAEVEVVMEEAKLMVEEEEVVGVGMVGG